MISIVVSNIKELRAAYSRNPKVMHDNLNKAIKKGIFKIQQDATQNARTMMNVRTGRLITSIGQSIKFKDLYGQVGSDIVDPPYPFFLHEGTRYITARPWLQAAADKNDPVIKQYFEDALKATLEDLGDV